MCDNEQAAGKVGEGPLQGFGRGADPIYTRQQAEQMKMAAAPALAGDSGGGTANRSGIRAQLERRRLILMHQRQQLDVEEVRLRSLQAKLDVIGDGVVDTLDELRALGIL